MDHKFIHVLRGMSATNMATRGPYREEDRSLEDKLWAERFVEAQKPRFIHAQCLGLSRLGVASFYSFESEFINAESDEPLEQQLRGKALCIYRTLTYYGFTLEVTKTVRQKNGESNLGIPFFSVADLFGMHPGAPQPDKLLIAVALGQIGYGNRDEQEDIAQYHIVATW